MSRRLLVAVVAVLTFAVACGDDASTDTDPATGNDVETDVETDAENDDGGAEGEIVLEFEDGALAGGVRRESVDLGSTVTMIVEGAIDEQVHVHGYDLYIEPDGSGTLEFDALIPGRFEVELEQSGQLLIELTVS